MCTTSEPFGHDLCAAAHRHSQCPEAQHEHTKRHEDKVRDLARDARSTTGMAREMLRVCRGDEEIARIAWRQIIEQRLPWRTSLLLIQELVEAYVDQAWRRRADESKAPYA